jgi:hypothetical protein
MYASLLCLLTLTCDHGQRRGNGRDRIADPQQWSK